MAWKTQVEKLLGMRDVSYLKDREVGTAAFYVGVIVHRNKFLCNKTN
jgi:hypothetical protein